MLNQSEFRVRPAGWLWHCNLEILLTIATDRCPFTEGEQESAMLTLKVSGRFHTTWQHKLAVLPDSGLPQCVENLCIVIVWKLLSYKTLNVELRLK